MAAEFRRGRSQLDMCRVGGALQGGFGGAVGAVG